MLDIARINCGEKNFARRLQLWRQTPETAREEAAATVAEIIRKIREGGFNALCDIAEKLDGNRPSAENWQMQLGEKTRAEIIANAEPQLAAALQESAKRLRAFHKKQMPQQWQFADDEGNILGEKTNPVARALIYAPGGKASYPSSVLMGVVPAKTAGVGEVIVTVPPPGANKNGAIALAAAIAGADAICEFGGAQAIAAFALGCPPLPQVDVVAGPGNIYVAEAKRQLFGEIGIDSFAGPSEVFILCDETANPELAAADMLAQAEHDELAQCAVISECEETLNATEAALQKRLQKTPRKNIAELSLAKRGALILARDENHCCEIANECAAEHLQIMRANPEAAAEKIHCAGAIFIGAQTPVVFGDYCAGTNHVLPTAGAARFSSPLGVHHFLRRTTILRASPEGAKTMAKTAAILARAEGFPAHEESALLRAKTPK